VLKFYNVFQKLGSKKRYHWEKKLKMQKGSVICN